MPSGVTEILFETLLIYFMFASAQNIIYSASLILLKIVVFGKIQWLN
jgi:hypothetical protein